MELLEIKKEDCKKFKALIEFIYDDWEINRDLDGDSFGERDRYIFIVSDIDEKYAKHIVDSIPDLGINYKDLIGVWGGRASQHCYDGIYFEEIDVIYKCKQVTEEVIIYKPIKEVRV